MTSPTSRTRQLLAEGLGTSILLATVVGSGIMGEHLAGGNVAIALLANTIATGAVLVVLIVVFSSVSGAHFNPVVSISEAMQGNQSWSETLLYIVVQILGACLGVAVANLMFAHPAVFTSLHERSTTGEIVGEFVATFGLVGTIIASSRRRPNLVPFVVALWIVAAYWFTPSTSFANPAVTVARALSDTFAGIRPVDVPGFIVSQIAGGVAATYLFGWMIPREIPSTT
jgi:glycerol uptake facilitator-like aquaporin